MKKTSKPRVSDHDLLAEYDFRPGVRGKYSRRYAHGSNVVVLDPDVAQIFLDSNMVNQTLRSLVPIIRLRKKTA